MGHLHDRREMVRYIVRDRKVTDPSNRFKGDGPERFHEVQIETTTVSSLLADIPESQLRSLAFKIDVEGYEGRVLKGMAETSSRSEVDALLAS